MATYLVTAHLFRPLQLLRTVRIISAYRKSQESLRTRTPDALSPETAAPSPDGGVSLAARQLARTAAGTGEPREVINRILGDWFEKKPLRFLKLCRRRGVVSLLNRLQKQQIILGVLSDYPARDKLKALNLTHFFDTIVSAHDNGISGFKPDTSGFQASARKMNLPPSRILYVGDRMDTDGAGAAAAGMKAAIIGKESGQAEKKSDITVIRKLPDILTRQIWSSNPNPETGNTSCS